VTGGLAQQLILTHAPSYVSIQQQSKPLSASDVPNVISNPLGLSDSQVGLFFSTLLAACINFHIFCYYYTTTVLGFTSLGDMGHSPKLCTKL